AALGTYVALGERDRHTDRGRRRRCRVLVQELDVARRRRCSVRSVPVSEFGAQPEQPVGDGGRGPPGVDRERTTLVDRVRLVGPTPPLLPVHVVGSTPGTVPGH